jgi:hypothetical protein
MNPDPIYVAIAAARDRDDAQRLAAARAQSRAAQPRRRDNRKAPRR